ncbi:chromosome-anchoring protein RacA [Aeribacillus composti]|uniref:MerR family transcriptional regulator n=1 Tax=Aeribacillus composti TaxID=1868734 RepID=UPI00119BD06B|nr:MerR family transcriptional regulator [Aeribacillus composti]MED1438907.1 MerR family transcriptional regulator [Aeribacillus composti]TVZ83990.1 chromosome-anchoring protein RacA [Aeribacillus composti]
MNTTDAAKKIGVSPKTVQRWIKQLNLPMERNELGHYMFSDEDIALLKEVHNQIKQGVPMQQVIVKTKRKESAKNAGETVSNELLKKIADLEQMIYSKADDVVSYQLLVQRKEIEELTGRIEKLERKIKELESKKSMPELQMSSLQMSSIDKPRKKKAVYKTLLSSIFGL